MNKKRVSPEEQLGFLAMEFRGTRDEAKRHAIAYAQAVDKLIAGKQWRLMPSLEDQLPDEWMPETFFRHWSLGQPPRRVRRRA